MAYSSNGTGIQRTAPVVLNIIIINVLVFVAQMVFDSGNQFSLSEKLAIHNFKSPDFQAYQVITNMFAHGGISHIAFNMFALYTFGTWLERVWGGKRFLIFYLICGVVAGLTQMMFLKDFMMTDPMTGETVLYSGSALGASGAIMGLFAAFAYLFPNTELYLFFVPIPIKAKYMVVLMVLIDLFGQFGPVKTGIGHYAHLSGLLMGFILVIFWNRTDKKTFY